MWITGGNVLRIDTSLSFAPVIGNQTNPVTNIQKAISDLFGVTIDNLKLKSFTIKRTSRCVQVESYDYKNPNVFNTDYVVSTSRTLTFEISISKFILWVGLEPHGVQIAITPESGYIPTDGALQTILPSTLDLDALKPPDDFFSAIKFLRLRIGVDLDDGFTWTVTFSVTLKKATGPEDDDVQIYLEYDSYIETLSGGLILAGFYATKEDYFNPNYDPFQFIELPGGTNPPLENWDLRRYFPNPHSVPTNIPLAISDASISINFQDDPIFIFTGSAVAPGTDITGAEVIPSPFVWDEVGVFFQISKSYFEGGFYSSFILNPPTGTTKYDPAELGVLVDYNTSSGWLLRAQLSSLSCGLIYSFFEDSSKDDLLGVLGDLTIANLNILFTYDSTGSAASFLISGAIQLDELELRLFYQYTSSKAGDNAVVAQSLKDQGYVDEKGSPKLLQPPKQSDPKHATTAWIFECDLGASTGNATIGSIANAFMADAAASLPSFVSDIKIPLADGSNGRAPVYLKTMNDGKGKILFALRVAIGIFSLTFVQVGGGSSPKRLVRFAADTIPIKDGIPLIDKLPQIFDELDYVWVNEAGGFLKSDVDAINNEGLLGNDILTYKVSTKTSPSKDQPARPAGASTAATANSDPVVITPGHHFVVISGGVVVLDHNFSASPSPMAALPKSTNPSSTVLSSSVPATATTATATTATATTATVTATTAAPAAAPSSQQVAPVPATSPTKNDILFSLGPLSISAMGLQFKEEGGKQCIILTFDATFAMGPLSFTLLGFGLTVNLKGITLDNLQNCLKNTDVALAGMALSFNKPPILIAGGFEHQIIQALGITQDVYLGGVAVSFPPYTFNGLGEYAVVTNADSSQYRSIFVYAKLDGPLITLELATISGIRLGFGFNSFVRAPAIDDIVNFPFINDHSISTTGNDPMAILKAMTVGNPAWVTPKLDSYWLAVGMSIQAFDVITATAVAVFEFGDAGLAVDIYADAVAQMPPEAPKAATVVYVEVGMKIEMNFADGYFAVAAMLAPTSFLLVPQCHLTGGLALSYWFPVSKVR